MNGRVLVIAGSDSSGGAGIQADVKTITALGGYAATAITALTAQNTQGVFGVVPVDPDFVARQIELVVTDIGAETVKTGMLHSPEVIRAVAAQMRRCLQGVPLVVDPVMVAKGGEQLLQFAAYQALVHDLLPLASIITPNAPEAEALTGLTVRHPEDLSAAADTLLGIGVGAVLIKGGHLESEGIVDLLRTADGEEHRFESERIASRSTHGTGCTLASGIATGIAEGRTLVDSVARARRFVADAIRTAPGYGRGHGPLNHAHAQQERG